MSVGFDVLPMVVRASLSLVVNPRTEGQVELQGKTPRRTCCRAAPEGVNSLFLGKLKGLLKASAFGGR
jgi:hypothetical protein